LETYRVLHFITRLIHGGADQNTLQTCIGLKNRGWEVVLVTGKEVSVELDQIIEQGIVSERIESLKRNVDLINDFKSLILFYRLCKKYKPDIVHTHTAKAGILGRIGAKAAKVPYVIHGVHGSPVDSITNLTEKKVFLFIEKMSMYLNDYYIAVGEDIFYKYCRQTGCKKTKNYKVVRSAFDVALFQESGNHRSGERKKYELYNDDVAVGMIGRIAPQKGYEHFLELCNKFNDYPRYKFFSVGSADDDNYFNYIYNKSRLLSEVGKIVFIGPLAYREIPQFISAMDIMVHTALWEGLPRVIVESLISKKPVISFNVEGASEVIHDGINGYIVPIGDVELMFKKIIQVEDDLMSAEKLAGAKIISKHLYRDYSLDVMIDKTVDVYKELLQTKG